MKSLEDYPAATITCRPSQAPQVFGVSRATIYRWAKAGHITLYHRGGMAFVRVDDVLAYITGVRD
ncbi:helix-turn-helix domain-containing protein [Sediminimonas sp.]|uniref:helix-turn-helix domain-containing protein n=1 Tax=Sediminimonas sp. TaxID=2823379 RepID=UPI0025D7F6A6|nr:helix-turn-helix domain-containing protein [Sediminimonas sp.]